MKFVVVAVLLCALLGCEPRRCALYTEDGDLIRRAEMRNGVCDFGSDVGEIPTGIVRYCWEGVLGLQCVTGRLRPDLSS